MYLTDVLFRICSQPLLGGAEPSTGLQTTAPSQDTCVLPYRVNIDRVDFFFPPQTWFLIKLNLSHQGLTTTDSSHLTGQHFLSGKVTWELHQEETQESHLLTDYS